MESNFQKRCKLNHYLVFEKLAMVLPSTSFSFLYQENYMDSYTKQPKLEWTPVIET